MKKENSSLLAQDKVHKAQGLFLTEVAKQLRGVNQNLMQLLNNTGNAEAFSGLYQFAHTLKGSGEMVGLREIALPAGEIITALTLVRNYGVSLDSGLRKFLSEKMGEIQHQTEQHLQKIKEPIKLDQTKVIGTIKRDKNRKILVVDDDHTITALIKETLTESCFTVLTSDNLAEAEQLLQSEQPDLLILDIIFPQGDGIEFCKKIRSNQNGKIIPIIFLSVKAKLQDRLSGFACGADDYISKPFVMEELVARVTAIFSRVQKFEHLVMKDELTGIYNRRYLLQRLHEEVKLAQRKEVSFSLVMVDLDKFKTINDSYGHSIGDQVLQYFVKIIKQNLRDKDAICRCGGDEFVIVMPETSRWKAVLTMQRIRTVLETEPYYLIKENAQITLSFSAGVVSYPEDGTSAEELLLAADTVMYQAKQSGRNQVMTSVDPVGMDTGFPPGS